MGLAAAFALAGFGAGAQAGTDGPLAKPGSARLAGKTGCVSRAFEVRVGGREIASVAFSIDGTRVKSVRTADARGKFALRVNPKRYRMGAHRVTARVSFSRESETPVRALGLRFERCFPASPDYAG